MSPYYTRRGKKRSLKNLQGFSVTTWIIIVNIAIYFLMFGLIIKSKGDIGNAELIKYFLLQPSNILQGKYLPALILHMFTHTMFLHLFVNMFVLFSLGRLCERIIGRKRFLWFYILSGLVAGILSVVLSGFFGSSEIGARIVGSPDIFMAGASGAIFAIAGLYTILLPELKFMIIFLPFFSLPARIMIPVALFGIWVLSIIFNLPIGNVAHFGGFLAGALYGLYLQSKYKRKVLRLQKMFR